MAVERLVFYDDAARRWRDKETGLEIAGLGPKFFDPSWQPAAPLQPDNDAAYAATMSPETELHYLREQLGHARRNLELTQDLRNKDSQRISDYIATIKTLVELGAHHWL